MRRILICNDDGATSPFLEIFTREFCKIAKVTVVVPASEQSWIGRAYSRHKTLELKEISPIDSAKCFTLSGTPADCVNIALSEAMNLDIDVVVSGINIGQNVALPLLWSSGTFAAAVEGASKGLPAFAFSQQIDKTFYDLCRIRHEPAPAALAKRVKEASKNAANFVLEKLQSGFGVGEVYNVNYPSLYAKGVPMRVTEPACLKTNTLFEKNADGTFDFKYALGEELECTEKLTDVLCLKNEEASATLLNIFSAKRC